MLPLTAYRPAGAQAAEPGDSPYGPLATEPDEHGLLLPEGFTARVIASAGDLVADSDFYYSYQGSELTTLFRNTFSHYHVS